MSPSGAVVELDIREKRHGHGAARRVVLADVTLAVKPGRCVCVMGPSGVGKTTLLAILAGLDDDFDGARAPVEGRLGMVFQEPRLIPWRSVRRNLALAAPDAGPARVEAALRRCRVDEGLFDRMPETLSLGEQRRVALARALVVEPALLVLDEPLASLDEATTRDLRAVIAAIPTDETTAVVMVEHDLESALAVADRIVRLEGSPGRIARRTAIERPRKDRDGAWLAAEADRLRGLGF